MRITNNMILNTTTTNINGNKVNVDYLNNQMTTQKKINRPSDDPVVAIRALRLRTSLSQVTQYYEKNIPDANSWLDVTESALVNINKLLSDVRTQCVNGSVDVLNASDRNTILESLKALQEQVYAEGNADYAGRTVFTGYRTNSKLTFTEVEETTSYDISQTFSASDIESYRYYTGGVTVPGISELQDASAMDAALQAADTNQYNYNRLRLAYNKIDDVKSFQTTNADGTVNTYTHDASETDASGNAMYSIKDAGGNPVAGAGTMTVYETAGDWEAATGKVLGENDMVFIKETGELVMGETATKTLQENKSQISMEYSKTGFEKGELRPEYYYNCTNKTPGQDPVTYQSYTADGDRIYEDISYTVAAGQDLAVNTQASDAIDSSIYLDIQELENVVQNAINANEKVTKIEAMIANETYADYKDELNQYLAVAKKEASYADDNLQKLFGTGITKFDAYMNKVNKAITQVGNKGSQLTMTKNRMSNQQDSLEELKSTNEDRELSDIIIDYTSAYVAYQASLRAASEVEKQTLLDYI